MSSKQAAKAVVDQGANINAKLNLVVKSGKFRIGKYPTFCQKLTFLWSGYKNAIKALRSGQSKLILISSNCPAIRRTELEYYAVLAKSDVHAYDGNNVELGTALGKLFAVSAMVITDPGDSDILESV